MPETMKRHGGAQALGLLGWLLLVFVAAAIGGLGSASAAGFYQEISRPGWAPPGWLFGPVWTALYLMMGVSAWLVWRAQGFRGARVALSLFVLQLAANALWSWLFFAWRLGGVAFAEILLLWCLIVATAAMFARLGQRLATWLLVPYLAWVTFAAFLNYSIWQQNPQAFV